MDLLTPRLLANEANRGRDVMVDVVVQVPVVRESVPEPRFRRMTGATQLEHPHVPAVSVEVAGQRELPRGVHIVAVRPEPVTENDGVDRGVIGPMGVIMEGDLPSVSGRYPVEP